jgi:NAD(P)H-quinone oxidoreductase subunit I
MDPHGVAADRPRAGQLPSQVLETLTPPAKPAAKNEGQSSSEAKEGDA